jgi:hypothetical protein
MDTGTIKVECKSTELIAILRQALGKMNLARIKFMGLFICALIKEKTVCFEDLATSFETTVPRKSNLRRIQNFMAAYALNTDLVARLIFNMLPHKPPYRLAMDRTNWKFGIININVLTLAIVYKGVAFPILIKMLDKQGNSKTEERIALMDRFIRLFGESATDCLLADREFVGTKWMRYLNDMKIRYYLRIRENFYVENHKNGKRIKAAWMFSSLKCGESLFLHQIYRVNGELCYLSASKMRNKDGKPELQILISYNCPEQGQDAYRERWQIETAFRAMKSGGFNIEDTHLKDLERIEKLLSLVMIAFTWAYVIGVYAHEHIKPIEIKKHGRRAKSLFKHGLELISTLFKNPFAQPPFDVFSLILGNQFNTNTL